MANPLERLGAEWIPHPRSPNTTERPTPDPTRPSLSPSPTPSDSPAPPETPNTEETSESPNAPQWGEPLFTESAFALHETGEWATGGATWCETKFFDIDGLTVVGEGAAAADLAWRLCSNTASEPSPDNGMFESCWETDTPHCGAGGFVAVQDGLPAVLWSADRASSLGPEDCLREAESKGSTDHGTGNTEQWNMGVWEAKGVSDAAVAVPGLPAFCLVTSDNQIAIVEYTEMVPTNPNDDDEWDYVLGIRVWDQPEGA